MSLVLILVAATVLVAAKVRARLGLVKAAATVMARAVGRTAIKGRRVGHIGSWGGVALIRGGWVLGRRCRRSAVWVGSAHWSGAWLGMAVIKSHPNRRTHHLPLWATSIIVAATSAASAAVSSVGRRSLWMSTPLWDTIDRRGRWVRLAIGRLLRAVLVLGLATIRRLLLIDLRGVVGMVILGRQGRVRCTLRGMLLAVVGVPLLLWLLGVAGLGRRAGVGNGSLRAVGRLLAIAVAGVRLVVATSIRAAPTSATVRATRSSVRRIPTSATARGRWGRSRRRRSVVVGHGSSAEIARKINNKSVGRRAWGPARKPNS